MADDPRTGTEDALLIIGAVLALLALLVVLDLAWHTGRWLFVPVALLILTAPLVRGFLAPRLVGAKPIPEGDEPELHRVVAALCPESSGVTPPRLMRVPDDAVAVFSGGWPARRRRLTVSDGLLSRVDDTQRRILLARELVRLRGPIAVIDAFAWALVPAAVIVVAARVPLGAGRTLLGVMGVAVALAAVVIIIHAREAIADMGAARLTGSPDQVADAIVSQDRHQPRGLRWLPAGGMLLVPPATQLLRDFTYPTAHDRANAVHRRHNVDAPGLTESGTAQSQGDVKEGRTDPEARMVTLAVLAVAAAVVVLVLTAGGGKKAATKRQAADATTTDSRPATATTTDDNRVATECPASNNGRQDPPVILGGGVTQDGTALRWWLRWCDDTDKGPVWLTLHLAQGGSRRSRYIMRRMVTAQSSPVRNEYRVIPDLRGWQPGMYRWRLVVRDVNAMKANLRGGPVRVPGMP